MDWAKTTARWGKKYLCLGIQCVYVRELMVSFAMGLNMSFPGAEAAILEDIFPDSKVHGANMGPIWGRQDPGGLHVGPMNFAIWLVYTLPSDVLLLGSQDHQQDKKFISLDKESFSLPMPYQWWEVI